jgi:Ulp1 family protease
VNVPGIIFFDPYRVFTDACVLKDVDHPFIAIINQDYSMARSAYLARNYNSSCGTHWVCISNVRVLVQADCTTVGIYDSNGSSHCSEDIKNFIRKVYKNSKKQLKIIMYKVQPQNDGSSCGLHALANATSLALGADPILQLFSKEEMRSHTKHCLETEIPSMYPLIEEWQNYEWLNNASHGPHGEATPTEQYI